MLVREDIEGSINRHTNYNIVKQLINLREKKVATTNIYSYIMKWSFGYSKTI